METTKESSGSVQEITLPLPRAASSAVSPAPTVHVHAEPEEQAAELNNRVVALPTPLAARSLSSPWRRYLLFAGIAAGVVAGSYVLLPIVSTALNTVSTDDAYINGHVTFVAPRVAGHVTTVLVDNNQRVKAGDLLVQLDKEPYQVQVDIKTSALVAAKREL
ncbi:MAG TPA: biotin/lipoyl-binding protein, partial [Schlesneria sp.]